jgi:hypothetical protein
MATEATKGLAWKVTALAAGSASAVLTRKLLRGAWSRARGGTPPTNPVARSTDWPEALIWAVASGVALGVTRVVAQGGAAAAWRAKTGRNPPGLEDVS